MSDERPLMPNVTSPQAPIWKGNLSIWLVCGGVLAIWFTAFKGLPILFHMLPPDNRNFPNVGFWFSIHLVAVFIVCVACLWNLFHTPSHGRTYRWLHVNLGRVGLISGYIGVISGFITVWWERYDPANTDFAIGVSIGGVLQAFSQTMGYLAARRHEYLEHSRYMMGTFFFGCLIPTMMRVPRLVAHVAESTWWLPVAIIICYVLAKLAQNAFENQRMY